MNKPALLAMGEPPDQDPPMRDKRATCVAGRPLLTGGR